ncbi:hypothetical protein ACJX0J_006963, partial [Zea mays]
SSFFVSIYSNICLTTHILILIVSLAKFCTFGLILFSGLSCFQYIDMNRTYFKIIAHFYLIDNCRFLYDICATRFCEYFVVHHGLMYLGSITVMVMGTYIAYEFYKKYNVWAIHGEIKPKMRKYYHYSDILVPYGHDMFP